MTTALPPPDIGKLKIRSLVDRAAFADFESGERYIDRQIPKCCDWQEMHRTRIFCAQMDGVAEAYGFYCLGVSSVKALGMGSDITRVYEGKEYVPFVYLHYIAVRRQFQNQKIGTILLMNLLSRCGHIVRNVGVFGIALNALTSRVVSLYERYGFRQRDEREYPLMILPTQSLIELTKGDYAS